MSPAPYDPYLSSIALVAQGLAVAFTPENEMVEVIIERYKRSVK